MYPEVREALIAGSEAVVVLPALLEASPMGLLLAALQEMEGHWEMEGRLEREDHRPYRHYASLLPGVSA